MEHEIMFHCASNLPRAIYIYIPIHAVANAPMAGHAQLGWHPLQHSWKSMACRPSVGFGAFRAGDSLLNSCGLWRMGHPYNSWDQGSDFLGFRPSGYLGFFHLKPTCSWWLILFPKGSTQIFFIFWIWPSIAICMPVHSWSTRMTIQSSKGGAGMRDSKRYIACMSNGVQTTDSHLNIENHGNWWSANFRKFPLIVFAIWAQESLITQGLGSSCLWRKPYRQKLLLTRPSARKNSTEQRRGWCWGSLCSWLNRLLGTVDWKLTGWGFHNFSTYFWWFLKDDGNLVELWFYIPCRWMARVFKALHQFSLVCASHGHGA